MSIDEDNIEELLEGMMKEAFEKEFEAVNPFDENISIEEAETQFKDIEDQIHTTEEVTQELDEKNSSLDNLDKVASEQKNDDLDNLDKQSNQDKDDFLEKLDKKLTNENASSLGILEQELDDDNYKFLDDKEGDNDNISEELDSEKVLNPKPTNSEIDIELPLYNESDTNLEGHKISFKAGDLKKARKKNIHKLDVSPENIEYMEYYSEDNIITDPVEELNEKFVNNDKNLDAESLEENLRDSLEYLDHKEDRKQIFKNFNSNKKKAKIEVGNATVLRDSDIERKPKTNSKANKQVFDDIIPDESLPVNSNDLNKNVQFNKKMDDGSTKNKTAMEIVKSNMLPITISLIILVSLVMVFNSYKSTLPNSNKTLVYELPTLSFSTFDESGSTPHNIKLNISVGVPSDQINLVDSDACYNTIYDTVSNLSYENFVSDNAQNELKKKIKNSLDVENEQDINYKIYISGIDVGAAYMLGTTVDTKADDEEQKKQSGQTMIDNLKGVSEE